MSGVESHGDADEQNDVEDDQRQQQEQQQQQHQSYRELSDDNPIENDVEHTATTADDVATSGEKSASADSGAEEVGSPEQQIPDAAGAGARESSVTFDTRPQRTLALAILNAKFNKF